MSRWISVLRLCHYQYTLCKSACAVPSEIVARSHRDPFLYSKFNFLQQRWYAKGKDKKKDSKGKKIAINEDEIAEVIDLDKLKTDMSKAVETLRQEYIKNLSLRSTTGAINSLQINVDGKRVDLMEVARIIRSTPGNVILDMATHSHIIPSVVKAIEKSGMNLNPRQDGTSIYIPIPRITTEYREGLCKNAKAMYIKCRDEIKGVQNKFLKSLKTKTKEGLSEDTAHRVSEQITEMGNIQVAVAERMMEQKQKELLE